MMANSSPPMRATRSIGRTLSTSAVATARITWSPAAWPWVSLTRLKWSMSSTSSSAGFAAAGHAVDLARQRQLEAAAVGQAGQGVAAGQVDQRVDQPCSHAGLPGSPAGGRPTRLGQQLQRLLQVQRARRWAGGRVGRVARKAVVGRRWGGEGRTSGVTASLAAGARAGHGREMARPGAPFPRLAAAGARHTGRTGRNRSSARPARPAHHEHMPRMPPLDLADPGVHAHRADFERIRKLIYQRAGISLHAGKQAMVYSRLSRRLRETGHRDFGSYLQLAGAHHRAGRTARVAGVRELPDHQPDRLLPRGASLPRPGRGPAARASRPIRIWCNAASTGEEPYSLAMTVVETLGVSAQVKLVCSDIDTKVLATAPRRVPTTPTPAACRPSGCGGTSCAAPGPTRGSIRVKPELAAHDRVPQPST
jgi:hypothetical protein